MCNPFSNNAVIAQNTIDIVEQNWKIFSIWDRFPNETRAIHTSEIRVDGEHFIILERLRNITVCLKASIE